MQTFKVATNGGSLRPCLLRPTPFRAVRLNVIASAERLRLNNLSPAKGSRRPNKRKGRGDAAGQGSTCGFGENGQKSRAGSGPRPGFEGGQTPLYRRLPKLRGIAGGMGAGLPKHVTVNLDDLNNYFSENEEVTLEKVKEKVLTVSGRDKKLPLKVLGNGTLSKPLKVHAAAFSSKAQEAIVAAGGSIEVISGPSTWTRKAYKQLVAKMASEGLDYQVEMSKKKAARAVAKGLGSKKRAAKALKPKTRSGKPSKAKRS